MAQQTAVEWLKRELEDYGDSLHLNLEWKTFDELVKQALQMEKEQIVNSWINGLTITMVNKLPIEFYKPDAEQYYNETYGGQGTPDTSSPNIKNK